MPFLDGITLDCVGCWLELELELELELLELLGGGRQGGTISVVTLLLAGSTSWSCAVEPVVEAFAPPGVTRIVLGGGGAIVTLLLLLELLELELLLLEPGEPHASMATVWVRVLFGISISFEPGGIVVLPDCDTTAASEHDVTAITSGLCCWGMTTVLVPGAIRAIETGSLELLEEPPPLPPHAASPATVAQIARNVR